jgi:hypothetical protein
MDLVLCIYIDAHSGAVVSCDSLESRCHAIESPTLMRRDFLSSHAWLQFLSYKFRYYFIDLSFRIKTQFEGVGVSFLTPCQSCRFGSGSGSRDGLIRPASHAAALALADLEQTASFAGLRGMLANVVRDTLGKRLEVLRLSVQAAKRLVDDERHVGTTALERIEHFTDRRGNRGLLRFALRNVVANRGLAFSQGAGFVDGTISIASESDIESSHCCVSPVFFLRGFRYLLFRFGNLAVSSYLVSSLIVYPYPVGRWVPSQ